MKQRKKINNFKGNCLYFYRMLRAVSPEYLLNFHADVYISSYLGKTFRFTMFRLVENAFVSQVFTKSPSQNSVPRSYYHSPPQAEGNYSSPQAPLF